MSGMSRRDLLRASAGAAAVAVPMSALSAGGIAAASGAATRTPTSPTRPRSPRPVRDRSSSASRTRRRVRCRCSRAPTRSSCATASSSPASCAPPRAARSEEVAMSSHREAPEISKDPCADSTDVYAFVSPDRPDTVTIIMQLHPARGPRRRPELLRVRRRRPLRDQHRQRRRRQGRRHLRVPVHDERPEPEQLPLQHRRRSTASTARRSTGRQTYERHRGAQRAGGGGSAKDLLSPPCNVGLRSTPNYPALANAGDLRPRRRHPRVRRAAPRRLLRRPRLDLRPRRAAAVPEPPPDPDAGGARRQRGALVQRAHARRPGADHPPDRATASGRRTRWRRRRRSACGRAAYRQKATLRDDDRDNSTSVRSPRCRGSATRCSTRSSCRSGARTSGTARPPHRDSEFAQYVARPELGKLLPFLYPGVFPNLAAYDKDRADLLAILLTGIPAASSPASRTSPGRRRPTCCGSTWRSRRPPAQRQRHPRRRPRRLPERPARVRRHRHRRAARRRRADDPARRQRRSRPTARPA